MSEPATWEMLLAGVVVVLVLLWMRPGMKAMWQQSQEAEKDWPAFLWPLAAVIGFIVLLVLMLR